MLISRHAFKQTLPSILITSVFLSGFLGNLGFFLGFNLFTRDRTGGAGEFARSLGGAIDANNMSLMAIACIPLIMHRFFYSKLKWAKLIYGFVFINTAFTVGTSYSRGGLMIFLLACVLVTVEYRHLFKVRFIGFILLGCSLGVSSFVVMMPDSYWDRAKSLGQFQDSSLNRRAAYVSIAMDAFMQRPIFGTGPDSFYHIFALTPLARISKETGERMGRYAHNTYLEILVGMGITGLVIFLVILAKALYSLTWVRQRYKSDGDEVQASYINACRLFLFLVLLYLVIFSETHHKFMLVGLVMSQIAVRSYKEEQQPVKPQELGYG
jgi:O-antigen ligase